MSDYLNIPLFKRLKAFRQNKQDGRPQGLGGGWHDENKKWHWVPHGFSTTPDFGSPFQTKWWPSAKTRWCENLSGHFRETGKAHELIRLNYKGWFVDNFQDSSTRGLVLQLPSRKGKSLYLAACTDPWNKNCGIVEMCFYDEKEEAARAADQLAECYAEDAREDDLKQLAESEIAQLKTSIKSTRKHIRTLVTGIRQSKVSTVVCQQLRNDVRRLRQQVREQLARIQKIQSEPWVLIPR